MICKACIYIWLYGHYIQFIATSVHRLFLRISDRFAAFLAKPGVITAS